MPVSTTACLVFELLGASWAMSLMRNYEGVVRWGKAGTVVSAIVISIFLSGFCSFVIQRLVRGAIRDRSRELNTMRTHGTWIGGGMATGLVFFLLLKGAKHAWGVADIVRGIASFDRWIKESLLGAGGSDAGSAIGVNLGMVIAVLGLWLLFGLTIHVLLKVYRGEAAKQIFPVLAVLGMVAMAVAFGQNDLANCASPGLATLTLIFNWDAGTVAATEVDIHPALLFGCGVLLFLGMRTKNATRVTKAAVNMGSQTDRVSLYAPRWCLVIGQLLTARRRGAASLAPRPSHLPEGKRAHFDPLRACVIMCVSASVIALASSYKLPVSTTYVTFAAVVGSAMGDRIFQRGDAALKLARSIWVGFSWFLAAAIAAVFTGVVCAIIHSSVANHLGVAGLVVVVLANVYLRRIFKRRGDVQAARARAEMLERSHAERFATEDE